MITYRGFSTNLNAKKYSVTDFVLAKQDLINYFNIRKGEKLMNPEFGTIIWDMLFEPLTEDTQQIITTTSKAFIHHQIHCGLHTAQPTKRAKPSVHRANLQ